MANNNGGLSLPVGTIISMGLLAVSLLGGGWAIFQNQFGSVREIIEAHDRADRAEDLNLGRQITFNREQYQLNFATAMKEIDRTNEELKGRIYDIHQELRHDFPSQNELKQIETRIDVIAKRLDVLEATRQTSGEVSIRSETLEKRVEALTARINVLTEHLLDKKQ